VLAGDPSRVEIELLHAEDLGLAGAPCPGRLVDALLDLASRRGVSRILLDGPQGWRASDSELACMRRCERATRTPGKTGLPGAVKPATWTRMAHFSVAVFDALDAAGWPRFSCEHATQRTAIESFPTHAWRMLDLPPLPAKARRCDLAPWIDRLDALCGARWSRAPSHDELQAAVAGLAGLALERGGPPSCDVAGVSPFVEEGVWREGFIVSARRAGAERSSLPPRSRR
jgi:hypothetical protein